ncbi:MAG: MgtC/SapB family protein [Anaerolineae bacterium]|jgi:putative Mg2+ transporter-C (MgtC) family protein
MNSLGFDPAQLQILASVALAMALGAAIGFERELVHKPAGLRTHMLVAGGAAFFISLGDVVIKRFSVNLGGGLVQSDPVRIIEAVITGVSFLGAGTIIVHRGDGANPARQVEGLTTAASILFAAAVGVSVALSQWVLAIGATLLVLITLRGLGFLQRRLWRRDQ